MSRQGQQGRGGLPRAPAAGVPADSQRGQCPGTRSEPRVLAWISTDIALTVHFRDAHFLANHPRCPLGSQTVVLLRLLPWLLGGAAVTWVTAPADATLDPPGLWPKEDIRAYRKAGHAGRLCFPIQAEENTAMSSISSADNCYLLLKKKTHTKKTRNRLPVISLQTLLCSGCRKLLLNKHPECRFSACLTGERNARQGCLRGPPGWQAL